MSERIIEIVIKGKNLTGADFAAARKELRDLEKAQGGTEQSSKSLGNAFVGAGGAAATFRNQVATMASAFTLASILEKGVAALGSFASASMESASNLVDLRNATGVSLGRLQEWTHVTEQGGIQLENMTKGAFDLGVKLAGGDGLRGAVEKLGLSWTTIKNLKPEDQLDQVLRAAEKLGPSTERNAILVEMFGAKGAIAIAKIVDGYAETADAASKAGDAQVESLDRAGAAWAKFKKDIGTGFTQVMGTALVAMQNLERGADSMSTKDKAWLFLTQGADTYAKTLRETGRQLAETEQAEQKRAQTAKAASAGATTSQRDYNAELTQVERAARNVDAATRQQIVAATELGEKTENLTGRFRLSEDVLKKVVAQHSESESAMRKEARTIVEEVDPAIQRLTESYRKQIEAHEKSKRSVSGPAMMPNWTIPKGELVEGAALVSHNTFGLAQLRQEQERVAATIGSFLLPSVKRVGAAFADNRKHDADAIKRLTEINQAAKTAAYDGLAEFFTSLGQIAGDRGIGAVLGSLGRVAIGFQSAHKWSTQLGDDGNALGGSFGSLSVAFNKNATDSQRFTAGIQAAGSIAQGAISIWNAASSATTRLGASFNGAMAGMQAGAAFGPWGAAAGAAVGVVAGLFQNKLKKEVEAANKEIDKTKDKLLSQYGTLEQLDAVAGRVGLTFKENWGHQGKRGLEEFNKMASQLEQRLKAVDTANQLAINGFSAVVTGMTKPWADFGQKLDASRASVLGASQEYETLKASGTATADQLAAAAQKVKDAGVAYEFLAGTQRELAVTGKQQLADLGIQAIGTFGAAMVAGKSYGEAMASVGPSIATLGQSYKSLGLDVEDVGLKQLILQSTVAKGNPELIAAASGLGSSMQGLAQLGMLNVDSFAAMQRTGSAMYARLQGEVNNTADASMSMGDKSRAALQPMQGYLQQAAAQAALLGIPLDANTQLLIGQSKELGIWQDKGKSAQDLLIEGMQTMVDKVDQLLSKMLGFSGAITGLPARRDIEINVTENVSRNVREYLQEGDGPGFARGTFGVTGVDFPDFGTESRVRVHRREAIVPYEDRIETAMRWLGGAPPAAAGAGGPVNLYLSIDPTTGTVQQLGDGARAQVQGWIYAGEIEVPARFVSGGRR